MTIYFLHEDAAECAKMLDDDALDKQIEAIAQVLCNVHHWFYIYNYSSGEAIELMQKVPLRMDLTDKALCKYNDWASECLANYKRMVDMGLACCQEWIYRFSEEEFESPEYTRNLHKAYRHLYNEHKLQSVIEWARDNVPDLPEGQMLATADMPSSEQVDLATFFPLVMPEIYKNVIVKVGRHNDNFDEYGVIESYRNYYRAKLEKQADRHVKCKSETHDADVAKHGQCTECLTRSGSIPKPIMPTWTRREKPRWLDFNWSNNIPATSN